MQISSIAGAAQQAQSATLQSASNAQKQDPDNDGDIDSKGVEQAGETGNNNAQASIPGPTGNNVDVTV